VSQVIAREQSGDSHSGVESPLGRNGPESALKGRERMASKTEATILFGLLASLRFFFSSLVVFDTVATALCPIRLANPHAVDPPAPRTYVVTESSRPEWPQQEKGATKEAKRVERQAMQEAEAGDGGGGDGKEQQMRVDVTDLEYVRGYAAAATGNLMAVPGAGGVLLAHSPLLSALLGAALPAAGDSNGARVGLSVCA